MKEKIFITGGAGFIGSHIAESLVKDGYRVIVYDNFSSGRLENLKEIKGDTEIIKGDILNYEMLEKSMRKCDFVSHQAAQLEIFRCLDNPDLDLKVNTIGTLNVLKAAVKNKVKKIINASSACVYGQAQYIPQDEKHPANPNWPYGVSKLAAEKYCQIYQNIYSIPIVSLRYSIVYGEKEWLGRVLTMFIKRIILENKPPIIFGNGEQLRDFIYVKDLIRLHNLILKNNKVKSNIYNVSTGIGTSVKDLAYLVIKVSNKNFKPIFENIREGDFSKYMPERKRIPQELEKMVLSPKKAFADFGWKPEISLEKGVKKEIDWILENPKFWSFKKIINV